MNADFMPTRTRISTDRYQKMVAAGILTKYDRIELIEGEMFDMAPIGTRHSAITSRLNELFVLALSRSATVVSGGPVNLGEFSEPQPDLPTIRASNWICTRGTASLSTGSLTWRASAS